MYEHLRNELLMELQPHFDSSTIDLILNKLDKVSADYEITEKITSLAVIEDDIPRIVKTYLYRSEIISKSVRAIQNTYLCLIVNHTESYPFVRLRS